jgi:hypothetical protein
MQLKSCFFLYSNEQLLQSKKKLKGKTYKDTCDYSSPWKKEGPVDSPRLGPFGNQPNMECSIGACY